MDIISAIEFDRSGGHLATGDRGGRVVLFERADTRDVWQFRLLMCLIVVKMTFEVFSYVICVGWD